MLRILKIHTSLVLMLLCISSSLFANVIEEDDDRIVRSNWVNSMGVGGTDDIPCIQILSDNILQVRLSIRVADPNLQNYPPLFVTYNWDGYLNGISNQILSSDLKPVGIGFAIGYEAEIMFNFTVDHLCSPGANSPDLTEFDFFFNLVTQTGFASTFYPVLSYPQLFPGLMFPEVLEPNFVPTYSGQKQLCCYVPPTTQEGTDEGLTLTSNDRTGNTDNAENSSSSHTLSSATGKALIEGVLYPNPAEDIVQIDFTMPEAGFYQIDLRQVDGQVVHSIHRQVDSAGKVKETIDISSLSKGIYIFTLSSKDQSQSLKLVKL